MNILEKIIAHKKVEVEKQELKVSLKDLEQSELFHHQTISLSQSLRDHSGSGIIAEYKRQSPSKGIINNHSFVEEVVKGYADAGVSAVSVLTDTHFFGGKSEDLVAARAVCEIPILRKDFTISEYQVLEAKSIGADVILLIAAALKVKESQALAGLARSLGLEVLLEIHNESELEYICEAVNAVGVNNRNLTDFSMDVNRSYELSQQIPDEFVKISESGLSSPETILDLRKAGFSGFLIGENFMKTENPVQACRRFVEELSAQGGKELKISEG